MNDPGKTRRPPGGSPGGTTPGGADASSRGEGKSGGDYRPGAAGAREDAEAGGAPDREAPADIGEVAEAILGGVLGDHAPDAPEGERPAASATAPAGIDPLALS